MGLGKLREGDQLGDIGQVVIQAHVVEGVRLRLERMEERDAAREL